MNKVLLALVMLLLPACAENHDSEVTPVPASGGTVQVGAQLINVFHDGHLYVIVLFNNGSNGGAILHSPNCPAELR